MFKALEVWLKTFETSDGIPFESSDLTNGVYLHNQVCASLAPNVFSVEAINVNPGTNWMVRRNNIKKVANGIRIYIETILNSEDSGVPDVEDFLSEIDLGTIAKDSKCENEDAKEELVKLIQLILSACVHGTNQQSYVQTIMGLDENIQEELMHSIHDMSELFQGDTASPPPSPLGSPTASPKGRSSTSSFDLNEPSTSSSPSVSSSKHSSSSSSSTNMRLAEQLDEFKRLNRALETENEELKRSLKLVELKNKKHEENSKTSELSGDTMRQQTMKLEKERDKAMAHVREMEEKVEALVDELGNLRSSTSEKNKMLSSQLRAQADELELASKKFMFHYRNLCFILMFS
jgi:hypothetical protein